MQQPKKKMQTTSLDEITLQELEKYASEHGLTIASTIRIAVLKFIKGLQKQD